MPYHGDMTGAVMETLGTEINGGASIGDTLFYQLLNMGKAFIEQRWPWMILRKLDTSKTVTSTSASAWNTPISLASITDFNRFYGEYPIRLFDGNNRIEYYRQ